MMFKIPDVMVAENPAPGITVAVLADVVQSSGKGDRLPSNRRYPSQQKMPVEAIWIGWSPERGLVAAVSVWRPYKPKMPPVPREGWLPFKKLLYGNKKIMKKSEDNLFSTTDYPKFTYELCRGLFMAPLDETEFRNISKDRGQKAISVLCEAVGPDMAQCLEKAGSSRYVPVHAANILRSPIIRAAFDIDFFLGRNTVTNVPEDTAGFRRRQFILQHPLIYTLGLQDRFRDEIDRGDEVLEIMRRDFRVTMPVMKMLMRVRKEDTVKSAEDFFVCSEGGRAFISGMAPSSLPLLENASPAVWNTMRMITNHAHNMKQSGVNAFMEYVGSTMTPDAQTGFEPFEAFGRGMGHLTDMAAEMALELMLPTFVSLRTREPRHARYVSADDRTSMSEAVMLTGIRKAAGALARHMDGNIHPAQLHAPPALPKAHSGHSWGEAFPAVTAPSGLTIRCLTTADELNHEGLVMNHCVAGYENYCRNREAVILSVGSYQGEIWKPCSTVQLSLAGHDKLRIVQHYAERNSFPSDEPVMDMEWWMEEFDAKRIVMVPGSLVKKNDKRPSTANIERFLGHDWRTPEAHVYRWDRWRRILNTRSSCFGDWLLSLHSVFLEDPVNASLCEAAVELDDAMHMARETDYGTGMRF